MLPVLPFIVLSQLSTANLVSQDSANLVTFHCDAETIEKAVTTIARQAHLNLGVAGALKGDIVVIDVTNVPAIELLNKLAEVEYSGWHKSGDTSFLTPDSSKVEKAKENYFAVRTKAFQKILDSNEKKNPPAQVDLSENNTNVADGTIFRMVDSIGAAALAKMRSGDRVVYSNTPHSVQSQLPSKAEEILNNENGSLQISPTSKVDLAIARPGDESPIYLTAELLIYDRQGNVISDSSIYIYDRTPLTLPSKRPVSDKPILPTGAALIMSQRSKVFVRKTMQSYSPTNEYMNAILNPVQFDPMLLDGAFICGLADAHHQNVIASLPDTYYGINLRSTLLPSQVLELLTDTDLVVNNTDKWLTVQESNPEIAREDRTDRVFLANLVKFAKSNKTPDLGSLAKIATECHGKLTEIERDYLMQVQPVWTTTALSQDWHLLELYGSFSDVERSAVNNGASIPLNALSSASTAIANKLVYGADCQLKTIGEPNKSTAFNPYLYEWTGSNEAVDTSDYRLEPTEVAPDGLPPAGVLTAKPTNLPVYKIVTDMPKIFARSVSQLQSRSFTEEGIAIYLARSDVPRYGSDPKAKGLIRGQRAGLEIRIIIAPTVYVGGNIYQDSFADDAPVLAPEDYPASLTKMEAKAIDYYKKNINKNASTTGSP